MNLNPQVSDSQSNNRILSLVDLGTEDITPERNKYQMQIIIIELYASTTGQIQMQI